MWGKLIVIAVLALSFVRVIKAQNECSASSGSIDPECPRSKPYCINDQYRRCVECMDSCDCGFNEYCSRQSGIVTSRYKCKKFSKAGKSCLPYSNSALTNTSIDDKYKCAILVTDSDLDVAIDFSGDCIGGTCRMCTPSTSSVSCSGPGSLGDPRMCATPGKEVSVRMFQWQVGEYSKNPIHVWLAIFFVFIFIMMLAILLTAVKAVKK